MRATSRWWKVAAHRGVGTCEQFRGEEPVGACPEVGGPPAEGRAMPKARVTATADTVHVATGRTGVAFVTARLAPRQAPCSKPWCARDGTTRQALGFTQLTTATATCDVQNSLIARGWGAAVAS